MTRTAKTYRLPDITIRQLEDLAESTGLNATEIIRAAVDRMHQRQGEYAMYEVSVRDTYADGTESDARRPQYARNRDRLNGEEAVLDELTDSVMMLLSFDPDSIRITHISSQSLDYEWTIDDAWSAVADVVTDILNESDDNPWESIGWAFRGIQSYPGMFPVEPRLRARLARIERKHRPQGAELNHASDDSTGVYMSEADDDG